MYFTERRLSIEIDGKWHTDRPENEEKEWKKLMQIELGCKFITINPDAEDFDICVEIGKIYSQKRRKMKKEKRKKKLKKIKSTKKLTKKLTEELPKRFLIDNISKILLELELEPNHLIKSNALKYVVKEILSST